MPAAHSLSDLYQGKRVLLIGGTGFLGSVALSMLMQQLPVMERLYVLVRKSPGLDARRRFMERVWPGPAFDPVRDLLDENKLEVVQGDLTQPLAGLDPAALGPLDLILNASGLVDFHAPLDLAHRTNVRGTLNLIELARATGAALVHTSTCYVAGRRDGYVAERVTPGDFPRREDAPYLTFAAAQEDEDIASEIALVKAQLETLPAKARLAEQAVAKHRTANGCDPTAAQLANAVKRMQRDQLNLDLVEAGRRRADAWGWPNVYTYTKAIAEHLLSASGVPHAIVRPAIIESALQYPLPGWNQNATTSAPLVMLALGGFDQVPAHADHVLDVIPVDMVAWGLLAAGGATMAGTHEEVYQLGTSDANPVTMGRVTELLGLYLHGRDHAKGLWQANREPRLVEADSFRRRAALVGKSAVWLGERARTLGEAAVDPRARQWLAKAATRAEAVTADIEKARALWDVFMPFSHDHDYRFSSANARALAATISPNGFDPAAIDWRAYWLDVHVPGLEKWVLADGATGGAIKSLPSTAGLLERIEGVARCDPHRQAFALLAGERPRAWSYGELWEAAGGIGGDGPVEVQVGALTPWIVDLVGALRAGRHVTLAPSPISGEVAEPEGAWGLPSNPLRPDGHLPREGGGGLPDALPPIKLTFADGPTLDGRQLAERLATLGQELGLSDTDRVLLAMAPGRDLDALALVLLSTLYHQAGADLVAAADWAETCEFAAPSVVALGEAGWAAAPETYGAGALARIAKLIDLAPASPEARREPFWRQGARIYQPLVDRHGAAVIALRVLDADDAKAPFLAVPPWRLRATDGQLEFAPANQDDWQPSSWAATALEAGGFRLEGSGRQGPGARLEAQLRRAGKLTDVAVQPADNGVRVVVRPDLEKLESVQAWRRHVLDEAWRYNQTAAFAERLLAVGLALDEEPAVWLDTRHKPRHDETPDLDQLRSDTLALVAARLSAPDLAFYAERLDAGALTYERLASWERVVVKALKTRGITAQGFLQAFEQELARTRTPVYQAAKAFGRLLGKVQTWAADDQPETPLLPEPVSEAVRKGLGVAAMAFYRHGLAVTVRGAAYIPAGQNFLVVANHASHLDGGMVKYALGPWGERLHALAAKDYFFGTPARRFVANHFTRLVPTDRQKVGTEWLRRAKEILAMGDCVLIFPEGTRTAGPELASFKASLGTLVRQAEIAILPIRIEGTDAILPKGKALPRGRKATIHVGPPIPWSVLRERTAHLGQLAQDRAIAALVQEAVDGLPEGRFWWLDGWQDRTVPALLEAEVVT
ncbi:MAG: AMP-dependent synthetase and ligase [Cyanobacteria bacterium RYN_339]|nr:AMP-dependent synthetase and ligase [Cyanobacteria bacterium RYN_339]